MRQTWLACALTTLLLGGCNDNNSDTATPTPTPTPDPVLTASLAMGKTALALNLALNAALPSQRQQHKNIPGVAVAIDRKSVV